MTTPPTAAPLFRVSVVVPVYRSRATLPELVRRLEETLRPATAEFEIILVNDGSPDDSQAVIESLLPAHPSVVPVELFRNFGQHNALLCGVRHARHEVVVTLDDDLQNPPEEIPRLLAALDPDTDLVYGTPARQSHSAFRSGTSVIMKTALASVLGADRADITSTYRAFRRDLLVVAEGYRSPFVSLDVLLFWATQRVKGVDVRHDTRREGRSNYNLAKLLRHAMNLVTGFSTKPLQFAIWTGFAFILFGMAVLAYVLFRRFAYGQAFPGFAFQTVLISVFSGAQLFALGLIGEYIGRIHFRTMDRPAYLVRPRPDQRPGPGPRPPA